MPPRLARPFQIWSYEVSHRQLVLRGRPGGGQEGDAEVEFLDALGMKVKSQYRGLLISYAPDTAEIDEFVGIPEQYRSKYAKLLVTDGAGVGFVVCRSLRINEG
ncbi:hypothetical protein [Streptomyces coriariae]|uniref:hypothetical protein n=1 Tax=Streptomyces coriariae TaxID=2864460 RepID=UPI001E30B441|nr:hypothetical protein [Streptomyces coriariae]